MTRMQATLAALAVITMPILLGGCADDGHALASTLEAAVVETVPHATGAIVELNYDGSPLRRGVGVKVYIDSERQDDLAAAVDGALHTLWSKFPVEPVRVSVAVVSGPEPLNADYVAMDGERLDDAIDALGLDPGDLDLKAIIVHSEELEQRYGPWKKPE